MEYARRVGKGYVYVLTHIFTGKKYVGKTIEPEERVLAHISQLTRGIHKNKAMQADFNKYHGDYKFAIFNSLDGAVKEIRRLIIAERFENSVGTLETALDTIIEVDSRFQNLMAKIET